MKTYVIYFNGGIMSTFEGKAAPDARWAVESAIACNASTALFCADGISYRIFLNQNISQPDSILRRGDEGQ